MVSSSRVDYINCVGTYVEHGGWAFHYDIDSDEEDDESGYRFGDHAFTMGEYVSIREDEELRTFRVVRVLPV